MTEAMKSTIPSGGGYDIAYVKTPGAGPTVVFLSGFRSDMNGTKALFLEEVCRARGQGFVRFDYGGHGQSGGAFAEGTISSWTRDALTIIDRVTDGPVILVGSSMGGWIGLLCAVKRPDRVVGFIGLAAAPDFTDWIAARLTAAQRDELSAKGFIEEPNDYAPEPYVFTRALIDDGAGNRILDGDIDLSIPVRLIQGMKDADVPWQTAWRIKKALKSADVGVLMVEDGDHRLSRPEDLTRIGVVLVDLLATF